MPQNVGLAALEGSYRNREAAMRPLKQEADSSPSLTDLAALGPDWLCCQVSMQLCRMAGLYILFHVLAIVSPPPQKGSVQKCISTRHFLKEKIAAELCLFYPRTASPAPSKAIANPLYAEGVYYARVWGMLPGNAQDCPKRSRKGKEFNFKKDWQFIKCIFH